MALTRTKTLIKLVHLVESWETMTEDDSDCLIAKVFLAVDTMHDVSWLPAFLNSSGSRHWPTPDNAMVLVDHRDSIPGWTG